MNRLLAEARQRLVCAPNTICLERAKLVTEAYRKYEGEPAPLLRAHAFAHVLRNMTLDLDSNPIFAGNTSSQPRAWMLLPEYGFNVPEQAIIENPSLDGFLAGDAIPDDLRRFWAGRSFGGGAGVGHLAVDLKRVVTEGLAAIQREAVSCLNDGDGNAASYRAAMLLCCRALIQWAERYSTEARASAIACTDPDKKAALMRVADACAHVPANPARNMFEALQSITLVHLAIAIEGHGYSVSPGLLDRVLLPYYDGDPETTDLIAAFMLKLASNSIWGTHSKTQAITLGGLDANGEDACSDLTLQFLDACEMIRLPDPHVFVRWHPRMDSRVKRRALKMLGSGLSMPMLISDEQTVRGFVRAGIPERDAWSYCVIGCNELGIPGLLADSASGPTINDLALLNNALLSIKHPDSTDMNGVLAAVRDALHARLVQLLTNHRRHFETMADCVPTPFTSALMDGCVKRGCDLLLGMRYSLPLVMENGFANTVNSLAAIDHLVFRTGRYKLSELLAALNNGLSDSLRAEIARAPKWGNDDDRADRWAVEWERIRTEVMREVEVETGERRHINGHLVRSLNYIAGRSVGASLDGREPFAPLADSIGAQQGTATRGPTAVLNSVLKLDYAGHWPGGYNLNLTLPPSTDDNSRANLQALVEAFFADGGQELQIGCLSADVLRDAKANPALHADLLVRVAGFNAFFVTLSPAQQDEVIARADRAHAQVRRHHERPEPLPPVGAV